jgi:muramoyltetrapeptide carboxypeptidase
MQSQSSIIIPPYLKPGDTIGITCPAGYMPFEKARVCIETLQEWGYQVKLGSTLRSSSNNYFSGTDEERRNDFQALLNDPEVKAILCGRGGYGCSRIIDELDFTCFSQLPKWVIGFSDITVFHAHIPANYGVATLHAPMAAAFVRPVEDNPYVISLKNALEGNRSHYETPVHPLNRLGNAMGTLVGGNLCLLTHLAGTSSDWDWNNKLLFIEDVGEQLYNVDRMLLQLKRMGKLSGLAGLVVGGFSDSKDTDRPFGKTVYEVIRESVEGYNFPICFGFPVSHEKENFALKVGVAHRLEVDANSVSLAESIE